MKDDTPPILSEKHYGAPSVFLPENILREARRQKGIGAASVPAVCVLDPDGDIVRYIKRTGRARKEGLGPAIIQNSTSRARTVSTSALCRARWVRPTPS